MLSRQFLEACVQEMGVATPARADFTDTIQAGRRALQEALVGAVEKPFTPTTVPVLSSCDQLAPSALRKSFLDVCDALPWTPSFRVDDGGRGMALCTFNDVFAFDTLRTGLVYVGAGEAYPEHSHPPQELYLTVAGAARWRHGAGDSYETLDASRTLYNPPNSLHGIRADNEPVVALYVLWQ